jgi:hypothetical protein
LAEGGGLMPIADYALSRLEKVVLSLTQSYQTADQNETFCFAPLALANAHNLTNICNPEREAS